MAYDGDPHKFAGQSGAPAGLSDKIEGEEHAALSGLLGELKGPPALIDFIIRQRQRTSQGSANIKIADFERLGVEEEIADKRKKLADLLNGGAALAARRALFIDMLEKEQRLVSNEIDGVNDLINKLPSKHKSLKDLRDYRDDLRNYYKGLGWFIDRSKTASESALDKLMQAFGSSFSLFMRNRAAILSGLQTTLSGVGVAARAIGGAMGQFARLIPLPF